MVFDTRCTSVLSPRASAQDSSWAGRPSGTAVRQATSIWPTKRSFLSVVVAAKDEACCLPPLVSELTGVLRSSCAKDPFSLDDFEIIIVDDGSTDETRAVLMELLLTYPELRGIGLAHGIGQSGATVAGIRAARGNWIATFDADLQNDPADLIRLWHALPGYHVALGYRHKRQDSWSKRMISHLANRGRNFLLGQSISDSGCSVRIFPRALALQLPLFRGVHRFFGPLMLREGCRVVEIPVNHRHRPFGCSHYNFWNRSLSVILDLFGVAWLMHRPLGCHVVQTWRLDELASSPRRESTSIKGGLLRRPKDS
jgi:dolichol-phosphate mannosyltransferase